MTLYAFLHCKIQRNLHFWLSNIFRCNAGSQFKTESPKKISNLSKPFFWAGCGHQGYTEIIFKIWEFFYSYCRFSINLKWFQIFKTLMLTKFATKENVAVFFVFWGNYTHNIENPKTLHSPFESAIRIDGFLFFGKAIFTP